MGTNSRHKILLVDDDPRVLKALEMMFADAYMVLLAASGKQAVGLVKDHDDIAAVVMDIKMPEMDGISAGRIIRKERPSLPVIFHTGHPGDYEEGEIDRAEQPFDYVEKGRSARQLIRSIRNAVETYALRKDPRDLVELARTDYEMIGKSQVMQEVFGRIRRACAADNKVIILGESGTGKELVAKAIHRNGSRKGQRFGIVNCNHKNTELVESELFGHRRGAFTGADADRRGLFECTDGGTIFLDEVGDLSGRTQIALLRVMAEGIVQQMGPETVPRTVDIRVLCATHKNLEQLVEEGAFRKDLYFRLSGSTIHLPPLRDRREDIEPLVSHFRDFYHVVKELPYKVFDASALKILLGYDWPGNVRQLKQAVHSLIVYTDSELIVAEDVQAYLGRSEKPSTERLGLSAQLQEVERTLIIGALVEAGYIVARAAILLDIDRANLTRKIQKHGIDVAALKSSN